MKTFRCEELGGLTDEGTAGIGLTRFLTFALSLEADRKLRLLSRERAGLGLVRFVLFPICRVGGRSFGWFHRETSGDGTPNAGTGVTAETKSVSVMRGGR